MKNFLETIDWVEIREVGNCGNCGKETKYYDTKLNDYVCDRDCGEELALYLDHFEK